MPEQMLKSTSGEGLADILERVLDKGIVIAGDIQIKLADVELLTIKIRLMIASVDKAKEMGINWWETDSYLSSQAPLEVNGSKQKHRKSNPLTGQARELGAEKEKVKLEKKAAELEEKLKSKPR